MSDFDLEWFPTGTGVNRSRPLRPFLSKRMRALREKVTREAEERVRQEEAALQTPEECND